MVELAKQRWQEWTSARTNLDAIYGQSTDPAVTRFLDLSLAHAKEFLFRSSSSAPASRPETPAPEVGKVDAPPNNPADPSDQ